MPVQFHKMHGAGNDFVVLDLRKSERVVDARLATRLADRKLGVGCDQILIIRSSEIDGCAARYEVLNADGSSAGQCGNGVRCIALFLLSEVDFDTSEQSSADSESPTLRLEGPSGPVVIKHCEDGEFECAMGEPRFDAVDIPLDLSNTSVLSSGNRLNLKLENENISVFPVSMGNPHAVTTVADTSKAAVERLGPQISSHSAFPEGCNAGFVEVIDDANIRLRVFERGTGETLACGSGACAAVAALRRENRVSESVNVFLPGGHLVIKWPGPGSQVLMKGPAAHVFRGTLDE